MTIKINREHCQYSWPERLEDAPPWMVDLIAKGMIDPR